VGEGFEGRLRFYRDKMDYNLTFLLRRHFLNETLVVEATWVHNMNMGDGLFRPKVSYDLADDLKVWIGYDLFYGHPDGVSGEFQENDRVVSGLRLNF